MTTYNTESPSVDIFTTRRQNINTFQCKHFRLAKLV